MFGKKSFENQMIKTSGLMGYRYYRTAYGDKMDPECIARIGNNRTSSTEAHHNVRHLVALFNITILLQVHLSEIEKVQLSNDLAHNKANIFLRDKPRGTISTCMYICKSH